MRASSSNRLYDLIPWIAMITSLVDMQSTTYRCEQSYHGQANIESWTEPNIDKGEKVCHWRFWANPREGNVTLVLIRRVGYNYGVLRLEDSNRQAYEWSPLATMVTTQVLSGQVNATYLNRLGATGHFTIVFRTTISHAEHALRGFGRIISPAYPSNYPNYAYSRWTLHALPTNGSIVLEFRDFQLHYQDTLFITDDRGKFETFTSSGPKGLGRWREHFGNSVNVTFLSDSSITDRGFDIAFFSIGYQHGASYSGEGYLSLSPETGINTNVTFLWMLRAEPVSGCITLVVTHFDLNDFDELQIYEVTGRVHKFSSSVKPRTTLILSNEVNVTFFGFMGMPSRLEILFQTTISQSEVSLQGSGRLVSPGYPNDPPRNAYFCWNLQASPDYGSIFLDLENVSSAMSKYELIVCDDRGKVSKIYSRYSWNTIHQTREEFSSNRVHFGSTVEVIFLSGNLQSQVGFDFEFKSIPFQWGASYVGSASLSSEDLPQQQSTNLTFLWMLVAKPKRGNITLLVTEFNVDELDVFRISDSMGHIAELSQATKISETLILSSEVNVTLHSTRGTRKYFEIIFTTTVQQREMIFKGSGRVMSPDYPNYYPNNAYCKWTLQAVPNYARIRLHVRNFTISVGDLILVFDDRGRQMELSPKIHRITESGSLLFGSVVTITFLSGDLGSASGFYFDFNSLPESCDGWLRGKGTISPPRFSMYYPGNNTCVWHVQAEPLSGRITLIFPFFNLNESATLLVNDTSGQKYQFSRIANPPSILLLGNEATVVLTDRYWGATWFEIFFFTIDSSLKYGGDIEPEKHYVFYSDLNSNIYNKSSFYQWTFRAKPEEDNAVLLVDAFRIKSMDMLFISDSKMQRQMFQRSIRNQRQTIACFSKEANVTFIDISNMAFFSMILFIPNSSCKYFLYGSGRIVFPKDLSELQTKIYCTWTLYALPADHSIVLRFLHFNVWWYHHILKIDDEHGNVLQFTPWNPPSTINKTLHLGRTAHITLASFMRISRSFGRDIELQFFSTAHAQSRTAGSNTLPSTEPPSRTTLADHPQVYIGTEVGTPNSHLSHAQSRTAGSNTLPSTEPPSRTTLADHQQVYIGSEAGAPHSHQFLATTSRWLWNATTQTTQRNEDKRTCSNIMDNEYKVPKRYPLGTVINGSCSSEARLVSWRCTSTAEGGAFWTIERQYKCARSDYLVRIAQANITNDNLMSILTSVENFASDTKKSFEVDDAVVEATSVILSKIVSLVMNQKIFNNLHEILVKTSSVISQLLLDPSSSIVMNASVKNVSSSIEKLLIASTALLESEETVTFASNNFIFQVTTVPGVIGVEIHRDTEKSQDIIKPITSDSNERDAQADALIYFAAEAKDIRKCFTVYKNSKLFRGTKMRPVSEMVLSAHLSRKLQNTNLVTMHFKLSPNMDSSTVVCGFWSYAEDEWLTFGCTKKISAPRLVICSCNHTANVALLTSVHRPQPNENVNRRALTVASRIGLYASISILLIVIITHLTVRNIAKSMTQKVLCQVSVSIMLLDVIFLSGISSTESRATCIALAALLHLFFLSSCTWISANTLLEYVRVQYHPAAEPDNLHIYAALPAWGLPMCAVGAPLIIDSSYYDTLEQGICWVNGYVLGYGVILPVALNVAFNGILLGRLTKSLCTFTDRTVRKRLVASTRRCSSLFILTGVNWIFGFLAIEQTMPVFHYLFCMFNVAHGMTILICHGLPAKLVFRICRRMTRNGRNVILMSGAAARDRSNNTRVSVSETEQATSQF